MFIGSELMTLVGNDIENRDNYAHAATIIRVDNDLGRLHNHFVSQNNTQNSEQRPID